MARTAIIGAGFVGLAAAYRLAQSGHRVIVFERNHDPGGLATGFRTDSWGWTLEHHYHHLFASDKAMIEFAHNLGLDDQLFFKRPKTSIYYQGQVFQLDSPTSLLKAPIFGWLTKFRIGLTLASLKLAPTSSYLKLEQLTAKEFLIKTMGQEAWRILWQPLFEDKFAQFSDQVNAAWFWARIKARTPSLGYFVGGFGQFANLVVKRLRTMGVEFYFDTSIKTISRQNQQWQVETDNSSLMSFDNVLVTLPAHQLVTLAGASLPDKFTQSLIQFDYLSATTLIIEARKPFFQDQTYWLNVNDLSFPFLAVVEHTHLIDKRHYDQKHIVYVGKYVTKDHPYLKLSAKQLLSRYHQGLEQLSPGFTRYISRVWKFNAPFAQPVVKQHHSRLVPGIKTPVKGLYWASMQHVYPWDRGTNFAVELGFRAGGLVSTLSESG